MHRLRRNASNRESATITTTGPHSPNNVTKRKSPAIPSLTSGNLLSSPRVSGDYHVLQQGVEKQRHVVREARSSLASCLDRLGEQHVRQKEYDNAMDAFAEALHEKRSIFSTN